MLLPFEEFDFACAIADDAGGQFGHHVPVMSSNKTLCWYLTLLVVLSPFPGLLGLFGFVIGLLVFSSSLSEQDVVKIPAVVKAKNPKKVFSSSLIVILRLVY